MHTETNFEHRGPVALPFTSAAVERAIIALLDEMVETWPRHVSLDMEE